MSEIRDIAARLKRELTFAELGDCNAALQQHAAAVRARIAEIEQTMASPTHRAAAALELADGTTGPTALESELEQLLDERAACGEFERIVICRRQAALVREAPDNFRAAAKRLPKLIDKLAKARTEYDAAASELTEAVSAIEGARHVLGAESFAARGDDAALREWALAPELVDRLAAVMFAPFPFSDEDGLRRARFTLRRQLTFVDLTQVASSAGGIIIGPEQDFSAYPAAARNPENPFARRDS